MTTVEKDILFTGVGKLNDKQKQAAFWAIECAAVCAWTLTMWKWMKYDEPLDGISELAKSTMFLKAVPSDIAMLPVRDLLDYQTMMRTCLWRLREFDRGRHHCDFSEVIQSMKAIELSCERIELVNEDMCVYGGTLDVLTQEDYDGFYCSVQERFRTVNWILDEEQIEYSAASVDT